MDENGFIDHTVDFAQRLSDTNSDSSWDRGCSLASLNVEETHVDESDPQQQKLLSADEEETGPVFIYNINGEVIDVVHPPEREPTALKRPEKAQPASSDGQIVINVACTRYEVVKKAAHRCLEWRLISSQEDDIGASNKRGQRGLKLNPAYDLTWHDTAV